LSPTFHKECLQRNPQVRRCRKDPLPAHRDVLLGLWSPASVAHQAFLGRLHARYFACSRRSPDAYFPPNCDIHSAICDVGFKRNDQLHKERKRAPVGRAKDPSLGAARSPYAHSEGLFPGAPRHQSTSQRTKSALGHALLFCPLGPKERRPEGGSYQYLMRLARWRATE
jgi:hypothetical protein